MRIRDRATAFTAADEVRSMGLYPYFRPIDSDQDTEVIMNGQKVLMMGSNNYLGLTNNHEVKEAARNAISEYGTGCAGSRFLNGTLRIHLELEKELADFVGKEECLLFSTGFQVNQGVISTLVGPKEYVIIDKSDHASIIDGTRLAFGKCLKFEHNDCEDLERVLKNLGGKTGLIVVDGVFSMEGDIAPLPDIIQLAKKHERRAQKIITVSDFVKKDIAKSLKVNKQKIVLTLNALSDGFEKASDNKVRDILSEYGIAQPYIFYVGNAHPHKNLERLLQAFEKVVKSNSNINLVLAGKKYYFYERLEKEWKDSEIFSKIKFAGFVDDIDLPGLYTGASLFVNPSMFEGFGLQLLEAFSCGTKVSCSNTTSLPEVGGEACYYFNPYSTGDMAETILAALKDTSDDKKELGYKQLSKFSWEQLASKTLNCYKQI